LFCFSSRAQLPKTESFTAGNKEFLLNGKPFVVRAAELHYPRIPKEYWEQRIQMCKAMGMNTVCIYLFWNLHEQQQDQFDFTGQNDVAAFVRLVQKNGMYCIVRPGPYVCAEWEMGGLPWWLLKKKDIRLRDASDKFFIERTGKFLKEAGKQLAPLQLQNGGNIIMVQVENEYASYGSDQKYMETIRDLVRQAGFDKVQLFRCDWSSNFNKYQLADVATTLNFGAGSNIDNQFKELQKVYPEAPLMCSEYWTGWFDQWGKPHETRSINSFIGSLKDMMDRKISFSLYMAHGGTSFGQWGGANAGPYSPMVASYDYNAPIDEQGAATDKFFAVRDLLKNYLQEGETLGEIPKPLPVISIPAFELNETAPLFANLPVAKKIVDLQPMEEFDQAWGRILYRTTLPASAVRQKAGDHRSA
jgi:beta-galactosidase